MAVIPIERTVSLDEPIKVEKLTGTLFTAESNAHKFIISVTRGGDPEAVTGTVTARFKRQDGSAIFITGGIEDGAACVVLTADCYNQPGSFQLTVFTTEGGSTLAIYSAGGVVTSTVDGDLIDGGNTIPRSVDEVAAYLEQYAPRVMTGATPTTDGVAGLVPAPNSLASTYYLRGDGVWDNVRALVEEILPLKCYPADTMGMPMAGENNLLITDAQPHAMPYQIVVFSDGQSHDSVTVSFAYYGTDMGTYVLDFVEKTGAPLTASVVVIENGNQVKVGSNIWMTTLAFTLDTPVTVPQRTFGLSTDVGTIAIYYRQNLMDRVQAIEARVTALENAST